ncbi:DNA-binding IclR family transcriptional regulator [Crossiella equi]|uniref:DNA-binding IclR family transcriptional regulator n=1 Tax=Crossiella equi TaxID=130796 RepID=A0ABS5APL8_9PSEU|nr:IclR family transcriptional regulator [Crossiella equi]MBP2478511.1 DNA-binding IclR family transcriptional regulator [Crossiella equi]
MGGNTSTDVKRSAADRLLALLGGFSPTASRLTLSQLAERAELPLPTAHRLLATLTTWGALERLPDGRYQVGPWLWRLGSLATPAQGLRTVALPHMGDLYEITHETIQLAVLEDTGARLLDRISGRRPLPGLTAVAGTVPLHCTGVGKAILAHAGQPVFTEVVARGLRQYTGHTITQPQELHRALARVRDEGVAVARSELVGGVSSVAAPVFGPAGLLAAVAVLLPPEVDVRPLAAAVRVTAQAIGRALAQRR